MRNGSPISFLSYLTLNTFSNIFFQTYYYRKSGQGYAKNHVEISPNLVDLMGCFGRSFRSAFRGIPMFTIASEETYQDGQAIFKEGSPGDWVYIILSGQVEISKIIGGKKFLVALLKEGEVFGELSFLGGIKRTATALAVGESTLGIIDREAMDLEYNKLSSEFRSILVSSVKRFEKMIDRVCEFSTRKEPRVQKVLSVNFKDKGSFVKAYTGNAATGGLFIKTENPMKQGERFLLKLQVPDLSEPLKIKCEVAWARKEAGDSHRVPNGIGVKFSEMSKQDEQVFKKYLKAIIGDEKKS